MDIIITLVFIALLIYIMSKKVNITSGLFAMALIIMICYTIFTGKSIMGDATSGSAVIDIFEYIKSNFASTFAGLGQTIVPIVAFSMYMNHIGATRLLVLKCVKPFKNVKNPYVLCIVACILGAVLKMVLPSQVGLMALLFITLYPIMVGTGLSKITAGTACLLGTAFDWGPACPMTAMLVAATGISDQQAYFFKYCAPIFPVAILLAGIASMILNKKYDAKDGYVLGSDTAGEAEQVDLPGFYALLPILPLVLVIVFSSAVIETIKITPFAAVMVVFTLTVLIEFIRKKSIVKVFEDTAQMWSGMGKAFGDFITLNACATMFAGALTAFGGISHISQIVLSINMPGIVLIIVFCCLVVIMSMVCGNSVPANSTFGPLIPGIASAAGISTEKLVTPVLAAQGFSRSMTPISGIMMMVAQFMGVPVLTVIKRNLIPFLIGYITVLAGTLVFM